MEILHSWYDPITASFEHLDEGYAEVEVNLVGADEGGAVENSDWDDGAEVDSACHFDRFAAIEEGRCSC